MLFTLFPNNVKYIPQEEVPKNSRGETAVRIAYIFLEWGGRCSRTVSPNARITSRACSLGRQEGYKSRIVEKQTFPAFELLRPTLCYRPLFCYRPYFVIGLCGLWYQIINLGLAYESEPFKGTNIKHWAREPLYQVHCWISGSVKGSGLTVCCWSPRQYIQGSVFFPTPAPELQPGATAIAISLQF